MVVNLNWIFNLKISIKFLNSIFSNIKIFFSLSITNYSNGLFLLKDLISLENLSLNSFNAKLNIRVDQPDPNSSTVVLLFINIY